MRHRRRFDGVSRQALHHAREIESPVEAVLEFRKISRACLRPCRRPPRTRSLGAAIVVKLGSDGEVDPRLISKFIEPIVKGQADYTKGNRFYDIESVNGMSAERLIGIAGLSLLTKVLSGYWNIMDPTNVYTAIQHKIIRLLPLDKPETRYFSRVICCFG